MWSILIFFTYRIYSACRSNTQGVPGSKIKTVYVQHYLREFEVEIQFLLLLLHQQLTYKYKLTLFAASRACLLDTFLNIHVAKTNLFKLSQPLLTIYIASCPIFQLLSEYDPVGALKCLNLSVVGWPLTLASIYQ